MINKNKFSIKDTKKVLHKVGKRWVVVSAVLLGLAAGGAAVTTANADTTAQAAQPTVAQQVTKNANMSAANHSFGAADPANATKAPASSTMKLGADNGINDLVNGAKDKLANHNLPSTVSGMKTYAKSKASSADVNHLTDLANLARSNGRQSQYTDLVNLANNVNDRFNNITVGSDTATNSDANTLFGMLNHASSDVSAINSGTYSNSTVSKVAHYLSDAQKLANSNVSHAFNASQLNSMVSLAGASELPTSVLVSGSSSSINLANYLSMMPSSITSKYFNNLSMSAGVSTTSVSVAPSYTLSLDITTVINNGINVSSAVSSAVNEIVTPASNSIQGQASSIASNLDNQILSQFGDSNSGVVANLNNDIKNLYTNLLNKIKSSINNKVNKLGEGYGITSSNLSDVLSTPEARGLPIYNKLVIANNILHAKTMSDINSYISSPVEKSLNSTVNTLNSDSEAIDNILTADVNTELSGLNNAISQTASSDFATKIPGSAIASKVTDKLYSMGIGASNGSFGPFASDAVSPSAAYSFLTSNNNANANVVSSLLSQFNVPNASGEVNRAVNLLKEANTGLNDFDSSSVSVPYNNLVNTAASLASNDTNYSSADSAYKGIYSDASNLNSQLTSISNLARGTFNIPKYSDVSAYATNQLMSEASSSVNSMESTSASMFNTLSEAEADNTNSLENTLLSSVINKLSTASTNYNNSLTGQDTSEVLDNETINFMSDNSNVGTTNVVGTPNETFDAQSLTAPTSYSLASDATDSATISINNGSTDVDVISSTNTSNTPASSGYTPFIPTFNGGSSMVSESTSTSTSASAEPSMASGNSFSAESKARYANYVLVTKALQLHTCANFTKKNGVAVIKPGVVLNVEKTVRARHGLVRYEVRYNNKNYFVTANKHFGVYDSYELAKPSHYRYAKVDTALQLHQSTNFTKKNGVKVVKPGMEFRINRVVKSNKGVIRYEVNYKGSVYFITANAHYVENAYLQKSNFKRGRKAVRVIKPLNEYRRANFTKRGLVRHFRRGIKLHVSRVRTIASGEVTRLQLTNGHYVTANKDLVKVIK